MKASYLSLFVVCGFFMLYLAARGARAQWFEDPSLVYQNISFDIANRGSYNVSECLYDMLQCWEAVRPDMVCLWYQWYASVCGVTRDLCAEHWGDMDSFSKKYNLAESLCHQNDKWT